MAARNPPSRKRMKCNVCKQVTTWRRSQIGGAWGYVCDQCAHNFKPDNPSPVSTPSNTSNQPVMPIDTSQTTNSLQKSDIPETAKRLSYESSESKNLNVSQPVNYGSKDGEMDDAEREEKLEKERKRQNYQQVLQAQNVTLQERHKTNQEAMKALQEQIKSLQEGVKVDQEIVQYNIEVRKLEGKQITLIGQEVKNYLARNDVGLTLLDGLAKLEKTALQIDEKRKDLSNQKNDLVATGGTATQHAFLNKRPSHFLAGADVAEGAMK